jgi:pilus assembly protein CpaB
MNGRFVLFIILACLIGGGVYYFARMSLPQQQVSPVVDTGGVAPQPVANTLQIIVVKEDAPAGTLIAQPEAKFEFRAWPRSSMNDDAYVSEGTGKVEDFAGAVVRVGMRAGEPLVRKNIIKRGESGFLAAVLAPGMRAVSLSVNNNTGVAGFIFPGDHVDLVLSHAVTLAHSDDVQRTHNVSETVLHDIRVVAVDQRSSDQEQVPAVSSVVTVEVTPEQAERVSLAQRMGELRAVLRSMVREDGTTESANDATKPVDPAVTGLEQRTFTLDSDLSQIIAPPGGDPADADAKTSNAIQLVRGNAASDVQPK